MRPTLTSKDRNSSSIRHKHSHRLRSFPIMSNTINTKTVPSNENSHGLSTADSALSTISFDNAASILTVSRMGSIFYCVEDLYAKVYSSLCTLDEFINLLSKSELIIIKQVTLSEKISIDQQIPLLKKVNDSRYRLISINSSDYLLKLKQLLIALINKNDNENQQREKNMNQIIDEMHSYRQAPTPILSKDKIAHSPMATKRLSSDDDDEDDDAHDEEPRKRVKIVAKKSKSSETSSLAPTQFGIFIQCNGPVSCNIFSTNETVSSSTTTTAAAAAAASANANTDTSSTTTATTTTMTSTAASTVAVTESEIVSKSTIIKRQQQESTRVYCDKTQQSYQNSSKLNGNNEQFVPKSTNPARTNSQSSTDGTQANQQCLSSSPSSSATNMPKKWRILKKYNNKLNDLPNIPQVHTAILSTFPSRCLYRSKSFACHHQSSKKYIPRRSFSLSSITCYKKEDVVKPNVQSTIANNKDNAKQDAVPTAESIDLTDESYPMPTIVNVEENVELANQQNKITRAKKANLANKAKLCSNTSISDSEQRVPPPIAARPAIHGANASALTKPTPTHHSLPTSSYPTPPYGIYPQESYIYHDQSQSVPPPPPSPLTTPTSHSYYHPSPQTNNGSSYPYAFSPSTQYSTMKKSKQLSTINPYELPSNSSNSNHSFSIHSNNHNNLSSSVVMPIVRKPNYYHPSTTAEQQTSIKMHSSTVASTQCRLPCCYPPPRMPPHHSTDKPPSNERFIYRQYATLSSTPQAIKRETPYTPDVPNSPSTVNRKQRRIDPMPPTPTPTPYSHYPSQKPYFMQPAPPSTPSSFPSAPTSLSSPSSTPSFTQSSSLPPSSHWPALTSSMSSSLMNSPSIRYQYPTLPPSSMPSTTPTNGIAVRKIEPYPSQPRRPTPIQSRAPCTTPIVAQNSSILISPPNTPHELPPPPNVRTRSIDLQRALMERGCNDVDKIPKLVVRHTKTFSNKTIETMGQLFPTWFTEPDYRCIHCFRCDQVFTPQQFMTHVDDENMQHEQPSNMTSIQLLTSEKMSEHKVGLWNQFCTNLTTYAREGRIGGFSTNRNI